jgi:hypothetical protein
MGEIEKKRLEIGNRLFELWLLLPEPKWAYPYYKQKVFMSIDNWHPPKTEKGIANREKGDIGI